MDVALEIEQGLNTIEQIKKHLDRFFASLLDNSGKIVINLIIVLLIFIGVTIALKLIAKAVNKVISRSEKKDDLIKSKRVKTLMTLIKSISRYLVYFIAFLLILSVLGFGDPVTNIAAFAGIISLAVGFGAQSLVQDVVTGLFMTFENQYSVGDFVNINGDEGTVEATAMRVTYLRTFNGRQVIIPNGTIKKVINYSRGENTAKIIVPTPYEENTEKVIEILDKIIKEYAKTHEDYIAEEPVIQGVVEFNSSSVDIAIVCKCVTGYQWEVERGLRLAIKTKFDEIGISFPYPHVTINQN